jgi:hypothetical protein
MLILLEQQPLKVGIHPQSDSYRASAVRGRCVREVGNTSQINQPLQSKCNQGQMATRAKPINRYRTSAIRGNVKGRLATWQHEPSQLIGTEQVQSGADVKGRLATRPKPISSYRASAVRGRCVREVGNTSQINQPLQSKCNQGQM